jgi:hypothetical protein
MRQCEYISSFGQCSKAAINDDRFCEEHTSRAKKDQCGVYLITNRFFKDAAIRHAESDKIKSLEGEIAILRALLERRLNAIENEAEAVAMAPTIKDTMLAIDKLVNSWHAMDVKLGNVLSKNALLRLAQEFIEIITKTIRPFADTNVTTSDVDEAIEAIANALVEAVARQENPK